jgi:drug/metabolite transporter (DMT)-like permease
MAETGKIASGSMSASYRGVLYAIITAVLWGVLAIALKVSLSDLTPADITWFRFLTAFVVLTVYYWIRKPAYLRILKRPPLLLVIATLCLAENYFGFIKGVQLTSPTVAQIFIQMGPVLLALSGVVFFKEKMTVRQAAGLMIAFGGLALFYYNQSHGLISGLRQYTRGIAWVVSGAITWTVYSVLLKVLVLKHPPMQLNLVIFGLPVLVYLPFVHFSHFATLTPGGWAILLFLGLNTLVAYGLLALAMHYTEANKISVILILNPILTFAIMAVISHTSATWITHEHYTLATLAGALTVLFGAMLTIFRPVKRSP